MVASLIVAVAAATTLGITLTRPQDAPPASGTGQAVEAAPPATGLTLTPGQLADAARWTAIANATTLTPGQLADAARWTAIASAQEASEKANGS
jgi:hypothetical protein